jgi:hypothetical protein
VLKARYADLEREFAEESTRLQSQFDPALVEVERISIKARKSDIDVTMLALLWKSAE